LTRCGQGKLGSRTKFVNGITIVLFANSRAVK
jgi:hypothetical protein